MEVGGDSAPTRAAEQAINNGETLVDEKTSSIDDLLSSRVWTLNDISKPIVSTMSTE